MFAEHTNENDTFCCPHCYHSDEYGGQGLGENPERVECTKCGNPFNIWTEKRPHQCSAFSEDG